MPEGKLVIGTRRYSSWSLRGWLVVKLAGLNVSEEVLPLAGGKTIDVQKNTPSGTVPYLEHMGVKVWESLAIAEYCAEHHPRLWPENPKLRALLRSVAAEMHAGFRELRMAMPMNIGRTFPGQRRTPGALEDIARIEAIWAEALGLSSGPYLHGIAPGVADAMFAPVVCRFLTWQPELTQTSQDYCATLRAHPLMEEWYALAAVEPAEWLLDKYENPA